MKQNIQRKLVAFTGAVSLVIVAALGAREWWITRPDYGLPYFAKFIEGADDRWTALGGTWEVSGGSMRNDSNDRGAKLLTGSPHWKNYVVEADLQLLGKGSVGILARVSDGEVGEDSLKGYFAAVRAVDNSLVLGAYDFAYHEAAKLPMPELVRPFRWYHVRLSVDGCRVTASAWALGMREIETPSLDDPDCFQSGSIGLRSNGTGGVWKNLTVVPVKSALARAHRTAEQDASRDLPAVAPAVQAGEGASTVPVQSVASLLYLAPFGSPIAAIRGSVVLTRPAIFVEDSTGGGVEIELRSPMPLKVGDEVEVTGQVCLDGFNPVMKQAKARLLREAVPVSPTVLTANQIATGNYDGRLVQVEGRLRTLAPNQDGTLTMDLDAGSQEFHAILPAGRSKSHAERLAPESRLRLRGISVVDPRFNKASDPFVILVRSAEDVDLIAGPPWSRPSTMILASMLGFGLIFTFNHVYLKAKHWRMRAVMAERERLAHQIHDTLAQSFAGIGFQLQAIRNSMPSGAADLEGKVDLAISMARTSHEEARRSISNLDPEPLRQIGLLAALRACAERMVKNGNVAVETFGEDAGRVAPPHIKNTLYLIGQEAIANSIRHANPGTIRIRLQRARAAICLTVEDDGKGFAVTGDRVGFGLSGMHKRAESISATLTVKSTPGAGTKVEVKAPIGSRFMLGRWPRLRRSGEDK